MSALRRWWLPLVVAVGFIAAVIDHRWIGDDGFINLRVIANLVAGNGPVFNAGERVEAVTSPLWIALLLPAGLAGVDVAPVAVWLGALLSAAGVVAGLCGAHRLHGVGGTGVWLPAGLLVYAVLPISWDYGTSGLENGLSLALIGLLFERLTRVATDARRHDGAMTPGAWATLFVAGLLPLTRPEWSLIAAPAIGAVAWLYRPRSGGAGAWTRHLLGVSLVAGLLPVAMQLFRMGYYAALTPNTAVAKAAFEGRWEQGLQYSHNTFGRYQLGFPLALLGALLVSRHEAWRREADSARGLVSALFALSGLALTLHVVHSGGCFMHGRMFVVPLFTMLLPVWVVPVRCIATPAARFGAVIVLGWAVMSSQWLRHYRENEYGIGDEAGWHRRESKHENPTRLAEYDTFALYSAVNGPVRALEQGCPDDRVSPPFVFVDEKSLGEFTPWTNCLPLDPSTVALGTRMVAMRRAIGITGVRLPLDVHIADHHGLADPIASRLEVVGWRRPGHERRLRTPWYLGRFARRESLPDDASRAAYEALRCGELAELREAVSAPLTPARFMANLAASPRLQRLTIPDDPTEARRRFCPARQP